MEKIVSLSSVVAALVIGAVIYYLRSRRRVNPIRGGVALITGGGSGIGLEIAKQLAQRHCHVLLVGRTEVALKEGCRQCINAGATSAIYVVADVTSEVDCRAISTWVKESFAVLHYLVLNAGQGAITPFDSSDESLDICRKMMEINYFANVRLIQLCLPWLEVGKGHIVVVSSLAGVLPSCLRAAYTASKHAIQGFSHALRQELQQTRITVCCPGFVDTQFHDKVLSVGLPHSTPKRKGMTAGECASLCLQGVERNELEVVMTTMGWLGYHLRPFFPKLVDLIAKRKALTSIGK